jgi:hypothetical protein
VDHQHLIVLNFLYLLPCPHSSSSPFSLTFHHLPKKYPENKKYIPKVFISETILRKSKPLKYKIKKRDFYEENLWVSRNFPIYDIKNNPFNQIPNPTNSQLIKPYYSKIQTLIGSNLILIPINPLHRITSSEKQQTEEEKI